jgi:hypothetical protein
MASEDDIEFMITYECKELLCLLVPSDTGTTALKQYIVSLFSP